MSDLIPFYRHRAVYDMRDYSAVDFSERVLLCVPRFAWLEARNLMRTYGLRRNAYAVGYEPAGYYTPDDVLFDKIDASISDFLGANDMCQDLTSALIDIRDAINNLAGCNSTCGGTGSGGAGTTEPPPSSFVDDGLTYPPEFSDYNEYADYKCVVANAIVAQIRSDMVWLQTASIATITASALAVSLLTPIPFDDILVLVGALVALAVQGVLVSYATEVISAIDATPYSYVCALSGASDAATAKTDLQDRFDADVSSGAALLASSFISYASINALFEYNSGYDTTALTMSVDCDLCGCPVVGCGFTIIERGIDYAILESTHGAADEFCYISQHTTDANAVGGAGGPWGPYCGPNQSITITLESGTITHYATADDAGTFVVPVWTAYPGTIVTSIRHIFFRRASSTEHFRIRVDVN